VDDERLEVLKLVQTGKVTPAEGMRLLEALERAQTPPATKAAMPVPVRGRVWRVGTRPVRISVGGDVAGDVRAAWAEGSGPPGGAAWLRLRVTDRQGRNKVNVQVPLGLIGTALRLGSHWLPELRRISPDVVLAAMRFRAGSRVFEMTDEAGGDRVEITVE
jgi:hypothetical protein